RRSRLPPRPASNPCLVPAWLSYLRVGFWLVDLPAGAPAMSPAGDCRVVEADDVGALAAAMEASPTIVAARLAASAAYAAWSEGVVVAYGWVSRTDTPLGEVDAIVR